MTAITANIPDFLARMLSDAARKERTSVDQMVALALQAQVTAWEVADNLEASAKRGRIEDLDEILANVPDVPPMPRDEK
jgi:predicted transcriptional regulator